MTIVFLGVTHATELPSDLQYALRFPERPRLNSFYGQGGRSWRTDNVFPVFEIPGPRFPFSWEGGNDPGKYSQNNNVLQANTKTIPAISKLLFICTEWSRKRASRKKFTEPLLLSCLSYILLSLTYLCFLS